MPKIRFKFSSNVDKGPLSEQPVIIILVCSVLIWLGCIVYQFNKLCWDHYFPYEGRVVEIKNNWVDYVTFESTPWEHMIIETPDGRMIDRLVSLTNRARAGIKVGDTVIKYKGFESRVQKNRAFR